MGLKSNPPEMGVLAHSIATIFLIQKTYSIEFFAAVREVMTLFTAIHSSPTRMQNFRCYAPNYFPV
jgi:hypothetical protein